MWKYLVFIVIALTFKSSQCQPSENINGFTKYDVDLKKADGSSITQTYYFSTYQAEWIQGREHCLNNGLDLVSIQDSLENDALRELIIKQGGGYHWTAGMWTDCVLTWNSTGEIVTFTNWRDYGGSQFENFPAIAVDGRERNWMNHVIGDGYVERFICESNE